MKLFKRDGQWHVDFLDSTGKRKRFSTGVPATEPQRVAESAAAERLRQHLVGTSGSPVETRRVGGVFNLAEALERTYVQRWKDTRSGGQLKHVVRLMEREIGHWLLADLPGAAGYAKLKKYRDGLLEDGLSRATANRRMSALKVALREAHREGDLTAMPAFPETLNEDNVRERYLTDTEEQRVMEWMKARAMAEVYTPGAEPVWAYMRALAVFLLDTGCRLTEALTLPACDGRVVHLKHGTTKSGKARVIPLTPRAATSAAQMIANPLHGKVDANWVGRRWQSVREQCGIPDVNIHILRHTCASRLLKAGVGLYTVSKWLGHSSVTVTERYAHLQAGALDDAAALLARSQLSVVPASSPDEVGPQVVDSLGTQR